MIEASCHREVQRSVHGNYAEVRARKYDPLVRYANSSGLSEPCRRRVIKPNDFRCRNQHRKGITVLLHSHQESSADIWPGRTEKVASSGNGIGAGRQLGQCHQSAR